MAFDLWLSSGLADNGWKAKIRDKERTEDPHISVMFKTSVWRWSLRSQTFLDRSPKPSDVPTQLIEELKANLGKLKREWDKLYPSNPV